MGLRCLTGGMETFERLVEMSEKSFGWCVCVLIAHKTICGCYPAILIIHDVNEHNYYRYDYYASLHPVSKWLLSGIYAILH